MKKLWDKLRKASFRVFKGFLGKGMPLNSG
jgi:hypothetical protein